MAALLFNEGDVVEWVDPDRGHVEHGARGVVERQNSEFVYIWWEDPAIQHLNGGWYPHHFGLAVRTDPRICDYIRKELHGA